MIGGEDRWNKEPVLPKTETANHLMEWNLFKLALSQGGFFEEVVHPFSFFWIRPVVTHKFLMLDEFSQVRVFFFLRAVKFVTSHYSLHGWVWFLEKKRSACFWRLPISNELLNKIVVTCLQIRVIKSSGFYQGGVDDDLQRKTQPYSAIIRTNFCQ